MGCTNYIATRFKMTVIDENGETYADIDSRHMSFIEVSEDGRLAVFNNHPFIYEVEEMGPEMVLSHSHHDGRLVTIRVKEFKESVQANIYRYLDGAEAIPRLE